MGWYFCNNIPPNLSLDASYCIVTDVLASKYLSTGVLVMDCLIWVNSCSSNSVYCYSCLFFVKFRSAIVLSLKFGRNFVKYWVYIYFMVFHFQYGFNFSFSYLYTIGCHYVSYIIYFRLFKLNFLCI